MASANAIISGREVPDRGPAVFAVSVGTLVLATVFVVARFISRGLIVRSIRWDDRVMGLAWVIAVFLSSVIALGTANGLGRYDRDIDPSDRGTLRRCEYVFSILYNPALMATKSSVLIFYLRLFKNTQFVLKYWSWALLGVINLAGIILTFLNIFQCSPISAAWNPYYQGDVQCLPLLTEFICSSPINIVTNLCLLFLPIPVLTGMRLPTRQKVVVVLLFSLGIFVTVVDVVRIYFLQSALSDLPTKPSGDLGSTFGGQEDFAYNASLSFMWSAVEVNVGITCACIPTLKPLILKLLPAMLYDPDRSTSTISKRSEGDSRQRNDRRTTPEIAAPPAVVVHEHRSNDPPDPEQPAQQRRDSHSSEEMTAMEFLSTPDMLSPVQRMQTNATARTSTTTENAVYFGFVNMAKPKSMLQTSAHESFKYCSIVAILFLLWGISYGLLNTLNTVVASIHDYSSAETLGLTAAYFGGGYFFGPLLVGEWILRRDEHNRSKRHKKNEFENVGGFKVTFIVGLSIYGIGTIIFWPSAVTGSYGGFMFSNFIVGFGLSVLEVAANAFIILCGPPEYGETRLLLAQAVQATGSVLSGLLANKVFFDAVGRAGFATTATLINVQWTYLAITLLCAGLALFFYYMPLPEVSDEELEQSAKRLPIDSQKKTSVGLQLRTISLILAVLAQYCYTAAQESNSLFFRDLLESVLPGSDSGQSAAQDPTGTADPHRPPGSAMSVPDYLLIAHAAFAVARFFAGGMTYLSVHHRHLPQPRTLLAMFLGMSFLFALLTVVLNRPGPNAIVIPVILFFFAEGPIWPLIFSIGLRGQGRRTKRAAAFITMGGSGGGVVPFIMYGIITSGGSTQLSYIVIVVLQVIMMAYPIFLEASRDAREMVRPRNSMRSKTRSSSDEQEPTLMADELVAQHNREKDEHKGIWGKLGRKLHGSNKSPPPATHPHDSGQRRDEEQQESQDIDFITSAI